TLVVVVLVVSILRIVSTLLALGQLGLPVPVPSVGGIGGKITPGSYTDNSTGINYVSDDGFIEGGATYEFATSSNSFQLSSLRYFPKNERNCYTLRPKQGKNNRYLIRAIIGYANYDYRDQNPQFDLYLGADYWATVNITDRMKAKAYEIIHLSLSDYINVCLINTGHGIPIISALELRLLDITMYEGQFQSLILSNRRNFGTNETVRYKDDVYDRIWYPLSLPGCRAVNNSDVVSAGPLDEEKLPLKVRSTAFTPINSTHMLTYTWVANTTDKFIIYIHIAEVEILKSNQKRVFTIYLNGAHLFGPFSLSTSLTTITNQSTHTGFSSYELELIPTLDSTLPPLYNAIETYKVKKLVQNQTQDRDAISNTKYTYGLKRNWQGDPSVPQAYPWDGLNCSYKDTLSPMIISLNLSSSGLMGEIATALANLTMIESLDMSNNNLTGIVPKFLADLDFLRFLNLTGNNFTRPLPAELLAKSKKRSLFLSIEESGDQDKGYCLNGSCKNKKHTKVVIPVIVAIVVVIVLLIASVIVWKYKRGQGGCAPLRGQGAAPLAGSRGRAPCWGPADPNGIFGGPHVVGVWRQRPQRGSGQRPDPNGIFGAPKISRSSHTPISNTLKQRNQQYTYSEVKSITNNFTTVIGKGGFGAVFRGSIGGNQVAVKILSESSAQGYKEFQAEVKLLMDVRHKNITLLIGYCNESNHKGIIYEYMANGNLGQHLFGSYETQSSTTNISTLELLAQMDVQTPPIVHRDVKSSNILLNEGFQAKLADFSLSRAFTDDDATHVSTSVVAGTYGYIDPELTVKSDVYSFGVVLLELITSRRAISENKNIIDWVKSTVAEGHVEHIIDPKLQGDFNRDTAWKVVELAIACVLKNIIDWVKSTVAEGHVEHIIDPKLQGDFNRDTAWKVVELAIACVSDSSIKRPTMNDVVMELKYCLNAEKIHRSIPDNESDSFAHIGYLADQLSILDVTLILSYDIKYKRSELLVFADTVAGSSLASAQSCQNVKRSAPNTPTNASLSKYTGTGDTVLRKRRPVGNESTCRDVCNLSVASDIMQQHICTGEL
ncbi:leucine-rich repeat transmembrane protein kinase protein, partial [Tanacetum coccineum]